MNDLITSKDLMLREDIKDSCRVATAHIRYIRNFALQAAEERTLRLANGAAELCHEALDELTSSLSSLSVLREREEREKNKTHGNGHANDTGDTTP